MEQDKRQVDWKAIERDYRAGIKTLRAIADEHSITHPAVSKRAKRDGWERDVIDRSVVKEKVVVPSMDEMSASGFVYVVYIDTGLERIYKVGLAKHFGARMDQHQTSSPFEICVAICYYTGNMRMEERTLHAMFQDKHVRGEWFRLSDSDLDAIACRARLA